MEATEWNELTSDEDKEILSTFMCDKMKEFCGIENGPVKPVSIVQNLLQSCYAITEAGRSALKRESDLSLEEFRKLDIPCYLDHCTAFSMTAACMGNPESYIKNRSELHGSFLISC